jgi:hypothetical protein
MKKQCLVLGFVFYSLVLCSQIDFGFRAGLALSTFENNILFPQLNELPGAEEKLLISPNLAISVNLPLNPHWSLQTEVNYLTKGGKIEKELFVPNAPPNGTFMTLQTRYEVQYLELPLLVKYRLFENGWSPALIAGLSYGYALTQSLDGDNIYLTDGQSVILIEADGKNIDWDTPYFSESPYNRSDFSTVFGLVVEYPIGKQQLSLDVRYLHDFTDWRDSRLSNADREVRHRNILITTGISF